MTAAVSLGLAACGDAKVESVAGQGTDPLLAHALAGPLMADPDLASRNHALAAIAGGGPEVVEMPLIENGAEVIAAAKLEAERLAGGRISPAPSPRDGSNPALRIAVTAVQRAAAVSGPGSNCGIGATYDMAWSLRLPQAFPIYPRGHLIEAAGNDGNGCRLRVVRFVTPVEPNAVIDFYHTLARTAHFDVRHQSADGRDQLEGNRGGAAYAVQARVREDGLTEADIVVNGV
ncbi:MAG: hypothetical protein ABIS10_11175 [Novosphingobium sp.]